MVAGILRILGVHMGEGKDINHTHENKKFRRALQLENNTLLDKLKLPFRILTSFRALVGQHDQAYAIWGLKDPNLNRLLPFITPFFRHPQYILVVRNPVSAAQSRSERYQRPFDACLARVLNIYCRFHRFVVRSGRPYLYVDYDEALRDPAGTVSTIAEFCRIQPDNDRLEQAKVFINKDKGYQKLT